jgi:enoyl-[acyl-carrier protein] reductase III
MSNSGDERNRNTGRNLVFAGKTALITGGTKGIGRATALALARQGCTVVVNYLRSRDAAKQTLDRITALGGAGQAIRGNIGNREFQEKLFDKIAADYPVLDFFISNAALGSFAAVRDLDDKAWDLALQTNAQAFLYCAQRAEKIMPDGGKIVALTSLGSQRFIPGYAAIGVSKAAIETLTRYLAVEFAGRRINVNAVCGGFIDTDALKSMPNHDDLVQEVIRRTLFNNVGTPEQLAGVILFLCSDAAEWITGQTIIVDGGYSLT